MFSAIGAGDNAEKRSRSRQTAKEPAVRKEGLPAAHFGGREGISQMYAEIQSIV